MVAAYSSCASDLCVRYLLDAGADINAVDKRGYTALMLALACRKAPYFPKANTEIWTLLLDKGADVNAVSFQGKTLLSLAEQRHDFGAGIIFKFLSLGLGPMLSRRDQFLLHLMVAQGEKAVLRELVKNGFPPLDLHPDLEKLEDIKWLQSFFRNLKLGQISPLAMAIICKRPSIARYFIANNFLTSYDIFWLFRSYKIRQYLQKSARCARRLDSVSTASGRRSVNLTHRRDGRNRTSRIQNDRHTQECLDILEFLSRAPLSLRNLCLIAISTALCEDLVRESSIEPPDRYTRTILYRTEWRCKPTFREKVDRLEIPLVFKRALLHRTTYSEICCEKWGEIPLGVEISLSAC
ncbi:ankyrin repeat and SOCS box protein 6 [Elysia marginata]|uniref:Ankyrin repeat and SOCS box protein 6 n=1 Tax=Elysia marginata TaxID=1093978 RepID=A0AAV4EKV2_9GAST|nr:ankyrin repeat and SOCS box protein 6 [Elysia marginata]